MNTDLSTVARVLAGIDDDGNNGDSATSAWAELLSGAQHASRHLSGDVEREYDALHERGPDASGRQVARIERLLTQLPESTVANVAAWFDADDDDQAADEYDSLDDALQFATSGDDSGHWITIGSVEGADGKRHGGTPVKIVGGKIVAGPKRLRGKSIKRLASGKPNHNVEYRRAVRKAVKEHGVKEQDLHDAVDFVHGERKIHHDARESAKEDARKLTGLTAGDVSRLSNAGHDYASGKKAGGAAGEKLRHFDQFAQELAKSHPELGLGDSDDASAALWQTLGEGKRSMVAKHDPELIDEAVRLLHASGGRHYADEEANAIPFSLSGGSRPDRGRGRPVVGVGAVADANGYYRPVTLLGRLPRLL